MYFSKSLVAMGLAAALMIPAAPLFAGQAKAAVAVDDTTLHTRVDAAIKAQPTLKNQNIDVAVANGVVTLTGAVQSEQRKVRAATAARVKGVTRVDNRLVVDPKAGHDMDDKVVDATKTAAHKTADGAKTVGEKTKDVAVATGDNITDAMINTKIHAKMLDESTLKDSDINVDVNNHTVTLKGTVVSAAGKARAAEIGRTTDGVKGVVNMLVIGPKK